MHMNGEHSESFGVSVCVRQVCFITVVVQCLYGWLCE